MESSPHYIDAYYQILNENAVFQGTSSTKSTDEWEVSLVSSSSDDSTSSPNEAAGIRTEWIVKDSNGNSDHHSNVSPSQDVWIVRGAVAVVVDREDYMGAPDGDYRAYCTVKVSHD